MDRYKKAGEEKKEFYFYLGLLSTLFAKMESNVLSVLGRLIVDDFVLAQTLIEKNTLTQNIELLKRVSTLRDYEVAEIKNLSDKISNLRRVRNLFVHGVWGEPFMMDGDVFIDCYETKLDYNEEFGEDVRINQIWSSMKKNEFRLSYIKTLIENVNDVIKLQNHLIHKLENHNFD